LEETIMAFSQLPILTPTLPDLELISSVEKDKKDFALEGVTMPE
jgi:hypothetical protein